MMTLAGLLAACLLSTMPVIEQKDVQQFKEMALADPAGGPSRLAVRLNLDKIPDGGKMSPVHEWLFEWLALGFAASPNNPAQLSPRFRVFSQHRDAQDVDGRVTRTLLRLWSYNLDRLGMDHARAYNNGLVDVYLSFGGKPGGQHQFVEDPFDTDPYGVPIKANVIYIYDLPSFKDPLEMAREVAHEYGHATLPWIGGYKEPEEWANGYLGERLGLTWLLQDIEAGRLKPADAMGATAEDLKRYRSSQIDPLLRAAALEGPNAQLASRTDKNGMDHFLGLAMWAQACLQPAAFRSSLRLMHKKNGSEYAAVLVNAVAQRESTAVTVPPALAGQSVWLPLGGGSLQGGSVTKRAGGWALVKPSSPSLTIRHKVAGG